MEQNDSFELISEQKLTRKPYVKPTVQVHGTVAQLSATSTNPGHRTDSGSFPSSNHRT